MRAFVWPFLSRVNAQDVRMLQLQGGNRARYPGRGMASTVLDVAREPLAAFWANGSLSTGPGHVVHMQV